MCQAWSELENLAVPATTGNFLVQLHAPSRAVPRRAAVHRNADRLLCH